MHIVLNQLLVSSLYTHRWRHLSALIKEASLCNRWWLTMRPKTCQGTEDERLQNAQAKWSLYTAPTLVSLRCHCRRGGRKSMKVRGSRWLQGKCVFWTHIRTAAHAQSLWLWQHAQYLCKPKPNQTLAWRMELGAKSHPLSKPLAILAAGRGRVSYL